MLFGSSCQKKVCMLASALVVLVAALSYHPPVGATYERNLTLPLLGAQRVVLRVASRTHVDLRLRGALALDDRIAVTFDNDALTLHPGARTRRLLRRARTSLGAARYDARTDTASVVVHPPLLLAAPVRFELRRVA